ncbi:MAG: hypothetical protein QN173_06370 [Armatimonadota bacterium]|nr:hypothetical protein [Armatimonadota bacterium]MDR7437033.1 hypothetical protein [Armatimonadota bacterium]MDR7472896.1 hypothetical protein [Armatimonadota bacterium]MDR7507214.1 hypothetical protein [Armatimonadota bacterium]MDR7508919.1 hypothetical protein [Armatimonadota bacterium]
MRRLLRACRVVVPLVALAAASAAGQEAVEVRASAGWSGWVTVSGWIPLRVEVRTAVPIDGSLVVEVPSPSGGPPMVFRRPVRLPSGGPHVLSVDIVLPTARRPPVVRLEAGAIQARTEVDLRSSRVVDAVVLAVSREAAGLEHLGGAGRLGPVYFRTDDLPDRWQQYASAAAVVLRDVDPEALTASQREALVQWVVQGGRLVLTGAERLLSLRAPWLEEMLPGQPVGVTTTSPEDLPGLPPGIPAALLRPRPGAEVFPSPARALMARWRYGAGIVTIWGWDAFDPRLRTWPGQAGLWREVLEAPAAAPVIGDLSGALPATRPLPGSLPAALAALSAAYILLARAVLRRAGPGRYGWVAVLALSVAGASAMRAFSLSVRDAATAVVQVSVAERLPGTPWARVQGVVAVYAPYGARVRLRAPPGGVFAPAVHLPVAFEDPATAVGEVPPPGLQVGLRQMVEFPVQGTLRERPEGLELSVRNLSGASIESPRIVRAGQVAALSRLTADGTVILDPTGWRPVQRAPAPPARVPDRLLDEVLAALAAAPPAEGWLVGWVADERVVVRSDTSSVMVHHLVVVPLAVRP